MDINTHLDELCGPEAAALRAVVTRLRAMSESVPAPDLTARVLDVVAGERRREQRRSHFSPWRAAAAAAAIAALAGWLWLQHAPSGSPATAPDPLAWLADAQEADGTWSPTLHGGAEAYRPALTALSALALAGAPDNRYQTRVRHSCDALARLQSAEGAFGGYGRTLYYNQAITAFALASLYTHTPCPRPVIERSLAFMRARQSPEGGWDYERDTGGNAAVTAWHVRALSCMARQGFSEADIPLRKALRWLRGTVREDGSIAYHRGSPVRSESLDALAAYALITGGAAYPQLVALGKRMSGALAEGTAADSGADCYRDYAKILALEAAGSAQAADKVRARMLGRALADSQDQWQKVGGAIYTSALTALAAR